MSKTTALEFLFRRYTRLAPSIAVSTIIILIYGYVAGRNDPIVSRIFWSPCKSYWWQNFVFLNNFSGMMGLGNCYDSVWTISVEMQLYVLTVPVVYFYIWDKQYGWIAALIWTGISFTIRTVLVAYIDAGAENLSFINDVYTPSWTRADAYGKSTRIYIRYLSLLTFPCLYILGAGCGMILYFLYDYHLGDKKRRQESWIKPQTDQQYLVSVMFWMGLLGLVIFSLFYLFAGNSWWHSTTYQLSSFSYLLWAAGLGAVTVRTAQLFLPMTFNVSYDDVFVSRFFDCSMSLSLILLILQYVAIDGRFWPVTYVLNWDCWYPIASLAYTGGLMNIMGCYMYAQWLQSLQGETSSKCCGVVGIPPSVR
jgi:hypothetical protein